MARGKRWQSACVACLIGVLLVSCHVAPYATGQGLTVEALPASPSGGSVSVASRDNASQHAPAATSTVEPADSAADSSTSQGVYSGEDFTSSGSEPDAYSDSPETAEEEDASLDNADRSLRRLDTRHYASETIDRGHTESPLVDVSNQPEPATSSHGPTITSKTSTISPPTPGSSEPNCTDRPYIELTPSNGPQQFGTSRTRRLQRTDRTPTPETVLHGAHNDDDEDDDQDEDNDDREVVELYAALYGYRIFRSAGDLMLTLIVETDDFGATLFAIDRINELRLAAGAETTVGLNIIHLRNSSSVQRILQQEVNYLKECSTNTIGIFVSPGLWPAVRLLSETLDYNIFPLPATHDLLFTKAAHLLYELPWTNGNSSALVHAGSNELAAKFSAICRHEHLCLENYTSTDMIYILLGTQPSTTNGTLVLVAMGKESAVHVSDLPDGAFVIEETDLSVAALGRSRKRYGKALRATDILAIGSLVLEVVDRLKHGGYECRNASIECLNNWKYHAKRSSAEVLAELELQNATQLMTFELRQKQRGTTATAQSSSSTNGTLADGVHEVDQYKLIASSNVVTNYTTVYQRVASDAPSKLGSIFFCAKEFEIRHPDFIERHQHRPVYYGSNGAGYEDGQMYWQIKMEPWVAAGLTVSSLGILLCAAILIFLIVRVCMDDILEGHPLGSILLLVSLIVQFAAFIPFSMEYTGYTTDFTGHRTDTMHIWNTHCTVKIFLVSMCYCMTFSLLLCRAIMLASIGSEGGFLSHINGYIQSVICGFSTLVQLGLSSQLVIVLHAHAHSISCGEIYYGHWFWAVIAYDGVLLVALIFLAPFIFRSQRNYREGLLLVTGSVLCLVIWTVWIPLCMFGYEWREAAISLGLVATALAVLVGIMIPRCFLMVRSIARSDLVQALPSLTSLAFAQANQFISDQSVYECVNPAMRQRTPTDDNFVMDQDLDEAYSANSEIPTLPLRGQRRLRQENGTITMSTSNGTLGPGNTLVPPNVGNNITHIAPNFYGISNPYSCSDSLSSISPNKITRF